MANRQAPTVKSMIMGSQIATRGDSAWFSDRISVESIRVKKSTSPKMESAIIKKMGSVLEKRKQKGKTMRTTRRGKRGSAIL